ncbi:MAG: hypothetical protein P8X90_30150 [Desulfobacterales bacterium]
MSRILNNLSSDQRRRYRKQAAALKLEGHRICDRLPDKEKLVLSSNVEDRDSVMEPYFPQLPSTAKRIRGDAAAGKAAVFGIEHLTIKTGKPLTIRGHLPVVIHTAKVTMEPHAEIRIETPTRLYTQVLKSDKKAPPRYMCCGADGRNGDPGKDGTSANSPGGAGEPGGPGGAAQLFFNLDLGVINGPLVIMNYGGAGGSGGNGGNGAKPNGTPGPGGPGGDGGSAGIVTLTYEELKPGGYVHIWNLPGLGGRGGRGGIGGDGKTKGHDGRNGRQTPPGSVSFGKKHQDDGT